MVWLASDDSSVRFIIFILDGVTLTSRCKHVNMQGSVVAV